MMVAQNSLFPDTTNSQAREVFDQWLTERQNSVRPLRPSSVDVYRAMWRSMAEFFDARNTEVLRASIADLDALLNHLGGTITYQKRVLSLFAAVTSRTADPGYTNPAKRLLQEPRYRFADTVSTEKPPVTLNQIQEHELIRLLTQRVRDGTWKRQRDRAMAATILGAGIKPGEALSLATDQIRFSGMDSTQAELPEKLALSGSGNSNARETPIARWGAIVLNDWLTTRRTMNIAGALVFPADLSGDTAIAKTTFYRQFAKLLDELGITTPKRGGHLLRHTFAVRQLEHGEPIKKVQDWLGLERAESAQGYHRIVRRRG